MRYFFRIRNWQRRIFCWFEREKPVCHSFVSAIESYSRGFSSCAARALLFYFRGRCFINADGKDYGAGILWPRTM